MSDKIKNEIVVAVLPFEILLNKGKMDHLVHGFVEDLITDLSRFGLSVMSSFSTKQISHNGDGVF